MSDRHKDHWTLLIILPPLHIASVVGLLKRNNRTTLSIKFPGH